jgi:hypothetical protein
VAAGVFAVLAANRTSNSLSLIEHLGQGQEAVLNVAGIATCLEALHLMIQKWSNHYALSESYRVLLH